MKELFLGLIGLVIVIGLFLLAFVVPFTGLHIQTGSGEHTGYITAVDVNGLFWKTPTVYIKTNPNSSQEDKYCADVAMVDELRAKAESQEKVTIRYTAMLIYGVMECNGEGEKITSIK